MKIIKLQSENILRLDAIEITPDGNLIVIGGENAQGKTSVLDSILLAMGGKKAKHQEPLKRGKKKGKIVIDVGDFTVTRTFTPKGGTLKVTNVGDKREYPSPQKMLDDFVGQLTFDPLHWTQMKGRDQLETLKSLVGLDFTDLDEQREKLYADRTDSNREVKRLTGVVESASEHNVPLVEVSVSELVADLNAAQAILYGRDSDEMEVKRLKEAYKGRKQQVEKCEEEIRLLNKEIAEAKSTMEDIKNKGKSLQEKLDNIDIPDIESIQEQINNAEDTNSKIRANSELKENQKELEAAVDISEGLTGQITAIDQEKADMLASAKFPVPKLSFDEDGVLYQDVPFSQASSAEKLRVSVAMGIALNPDLKVLLIRDGSLLDDNNLKAIAKMAEKSGHQIWLERVTDSESECSVLICDGMVKE